MIRRRPKPLRWLAPFTALALALAAATGTAHAQAPAGSVPLPPSLDDGPRALASRPRYPMSASLAPNSGMLGQRLVYRGWVIVPKGTRVRFDRPSAGGEFTWGELHAGRQLATRAEVPGINWRDPIDSVWVETTVQVFQSGRVSIPGLTLRVGEDGSARLGRLPVVRAVVAGMLTPADSNAELRPVRGPHGAPWWERVPWTWVVVGLLAIALAVWLVRRLRRKKPVPVAPAAPVVAAPRVSPADEALRALAALRARQLPEKGQFAEHAFELTRLTRRFLEVTLVTPRPGDTSAELVDRLRSGVLGPDRLERLSALLALWDRVKFARAPLTVAEARRAEDAVEAFVSRPDQVPREVA